MIKALIFDLDNCLAPANEVGEQLVEPAFTAIRNANRGTVSEETLREAFSECWRHPFDFVAAKYGFSNEMVSAGWDAFSRMEVETPMKGYPDLNVLRELTPDLYLVTSGFRRLQQSKIRALGFEHLFKGIFIDAIDEPERKGKEGIFRSIMAAADLSPEEVIVVGDNPDSEIEVGNKLGIRTVQILRPGVPHGDMATHHISTLAELKAMVQNSGGRA
ncbi:MAG: HAD family hydrolase [Terrimicrobiaceae bacterium]